MGRFEGKQLVAHRSNTYRGGRCTIFRGDTAWVVMHKGRFIGERDTYDEAEKLAHNETGRLDSKVTANLAADYDALDEAEAKEDDEADAAEFGSDTYVPFRNED